MGNKVKLNKVVALYSVLALFVMGPMLLPGYILTLDIVFTPKIPAPSGLSNTYLFQWAQHLLNFVLPGQLIEKIIIFLILFLCGVGAHRLINTKSIYPKLFAGIFYMINPFTYERWMAGQYLVLAGYALLPFSAKALFEFVKKPGRRKATYLALWYVAIACVSIHILILAIIFGFITIFIYLVSKFKDREYRKELLIYSGLGILATCALNLYWLLPIFAGNSIISHTLDSITSVDSHAFATASDAHTGLFFNVLSMYGFWLEDDRRFAMPNSNLLIWIVGFILLVALIILGARTLFKKRSLNALALGITGFIAFIFALGVNAPVTGKAIVWVLEYIPFINGFRDSQKFTALLVLAYVYFAGHGLNYLLIKIKDWGPLKLELIRDFALVLPVLYVTTMLLGFANQLKPVQYPQSWYGFNDQLKNNPPDGKVLFLPWHLYMSYNFAPRVIANPAGQFFDAKVISSSNAEYGGIKDPNLSYEESYIENEVLGRKDSTRLGQILANIGIKYVVLSEGQDFEQYGFLDNQADLTKVSSNPGLTVYKNEAYQK